MWRARPRCLASQSARTCSANGTSRLGQWMSRRSTCSIPSRFRLASADLCRRPVGNVGRPDFRRDEDLVARRDVRADRLADLRLVAVHGRRVDVPVAGVERRLHGADRARRRAAARCRSRSPGSPRRSPSRSVSSTCLSADRSFGRISGRVGERRATSSKPAARKTGASPTKPSPQTSLRSVSSGQASTARRPAPRAKRQRAVEQHPHQPLPAIAGADVEAVHRPDALDRVERRGDARARSSAAASRAGRRRTSRPPVPPS